MENTFEYSEDKKYNWTDPWVRVDGGFPKTSIAKFYRSYADTDINLPNYNELDQLQLDGVIIPIIKVNNTVLDWDQIKEFTISSIDFEPKVSVLVNDPMQRISKTDVPGMRNKLTVIMTMPIDGAYKKIALDFYITNVSYYGTEISYSGELFMPALRKKLTKGWQFHPDSGCHDKQCNLPGNKYPSTYELLHVIAEETGLGFAATDQCKEINDNKIRICHSQTYPEVIKEHTRFGGLNDKSIFDSWIDFYGYIVMVNLPFIFENHITKDELKTHAIEGTMITDTREYLQTLEYTDFIPRVLTNGKGYDTMLNIYINSYRSSVNNSDIFYNGTNNTYYSITPIEFGGNNSITTTKTEIIENSDDGENHKDDYSFEKVSFIGCEMGDPEENNTPILAQTQLHDSYLDKINAQTLEIDIDGVNFAFMRGILINVIIYDYDTDNKEQLVANESYYNSENTEMTVDNEIKDKEQFDDPRYGVVNNQLTGLYYINGVEIKYNSFSKKMYQTLYLIKKDKIKNFTSIRK